MNTSLTPQTHLGKRSAGKLHFALLRLILLAVALLGLASGAQAQRINLHFGASSYTGTTATSPATPLSSSGNWNNINVAATESDVAVVYSDNSAGPTLSFDGGRSDGWSSSSAADKTFNYTTVSGVYDVANLYENGLTSGNNSRAGMRIRGLSPGTYNVYMVPIFNSPLAAGSFDNQPARFYIGTGNTEDRNTGTYALVTTNARPTQFIDTAKTTWVPATDGSVNYNYVGAANVAINTTSNWLTFIFDYPATEPKRAWPCVIQIELVSSCTPPTINTQPAAQTNCAGQQVQFSVSATGTTLSYQWRRNGTNLSNGGTVSGATSATLTINPVSTGDAATAAAGYDCVVTEGGTCTTTSTRVALGVNTAPSISGQPTNATAAVSATANFTVTATGSGLAYQWQISSNAGVNWDYVNGGASVNNGSDGNGGTTASFTTVAATAAMNQYKYRCLVSGTCSPATNSNPATLTVTVCNPAGVTDPANQTVTSPATATFTVVGSGSAPTYQWYYTTDNWVTTSNLISSATNASYTTPATTGSMNGRQYRCVVSVGCDSVVATSAAATLTVNCASLLVTTNPTNKTVSTPATANFVVAATGSPTLSYQWYSSTDNWVTVSNLISGATSASYTTPATAGTDNGTQFRCVVTSSCDGSTATSTAATLTAIDSSVTSFRSAASGSWQELSTWEMSTNNGASWFPAVFTPVAVNSTNITISAGTLVTNLSNATADQIVVAVNGMLVVSSNKLTVTNASSAGLDVYGTLLMIGGNSSSQGLALSSGANMVVQSGGVFIHNGTDNTPLTTTGATLTFASGGKYQLQRAGGEIPIATWSAGSTCEIAYNTASSSKPAVAGLGQAFGNFTWNCPLQSGETDLAGGLVNVTGDFLLADSAGMGLKNLGENATFGGNVTISNGAANMANTGGPWTCTIKGNLTVAAGGGLNSGVPVTMVINGLGVQNYTCDGNNVATKLSWNVDTGSTFNLNSDLPLTAAGSTLTANGTVNLNGQKLLADLLAGSGTVRNEGSGSGLLVLGTGGSGNTISTAPALVNGTSGTLGLGKSGSGLLTITDPQAFSGGLVVSNGTVLVNNVSGSGTGSGAVTVVDGTLGGTGIIAGSVTVESGGNVAPGASIGDLTINGILTLGGTFTAEVNTGDDPNTDRVLGTSAKSYGGTLQIQNLGSPLTTSDTFQIFPAGTRTGVFGPIVPATPDNNAGLAWNTSTLTTDGTLRISSVGGGPDTTPTNIVSSVSGGNLTLSWPADHIGWTLQTQTNSRSVGLNLATNAWFDVSDSTTTNLMVIPISSGNPTVFYRLMLVVP